LISEWNALARDGERSRLILDWIGGCAAGRVLDVGCGAGQEMLPVLRHFTDCQGVGVDISAEFPEVGRLLYDATGVSGRVRFVRAKGEALPFSDASFDLVICRVALPYMRNMDALAEMFRVLTNDGVVVLQIHHGRYYVRQLARHLKLLNFWRVLHAVRVLLAGSVFHLTGRQPAGGALGAEIFLSRRNAVRIFRGLGMSIDRVVGDRRGVAQVFVLRKAPLLP